MNLPIHLGGHKGRTHIDRGILNWIKTQLKANSFLDIGCGPGGMVYAGNDLGIDALGVDGDHTLTRSKKDLFITHDYTSGPLRLDKKFDVGWCCEFVEHVHSEFEANYITTFNSCKILLMTYSEPGTPGHHHVNCQPKSYWIDLLEKNNFRYDQNLTEESRSMSTMERDFYRLRGLAFKNLNYE